jgi:hypothetical protein
MNSTRMMVAVAALLALAACAEEMPAGTYAVFSTPECSVGFPFAGLRVDGDRAELLAIKDGGPLVIGEVGVTRDGDVVTVAPIDAAYTFAEGGWWRGQLGEARLVQGPDSMLGDGTWSGRVHLAYEISQTGEDLTTGECDTTLRARLCDADGIPGCALLVKLTAVDQGHDMAHLPRVALHLGDHAATSLRSNSSHHGTGTAPLVYRSTASAWDTLGICVPRSHLDTVKTLLSSSATATWCCVTGGFCAARHAASALPPRVLINA